MEKMCRPWKLGDKHILECHDLSCGLLGIINITPDSFSDRDGICPDIEDLLECAKEIYTCDARFCDTLRISHVSSSFGQFIPYCHHAIIDVGAESTRPGAVPIDVETEKKRLLPFLKRLRKELPDAIISVDTRKAIVAKFALSNGADIINDVSGLSDPEMVYVLNAYNAGYILTNNTPYTDANTLNKWFEDKLNFLVRSGLSEQNVAFDPGIGFGKTGEESWSIIKDLHKIYCNDPKRPLCLGMSRKSFLDNKIGIPMKLRDYATSALIYRVFPNVSFLRVHNIGAAVVSLAVAETLYREDFAYSDGNIYK